MQLEPVPEWVTPRTRRLLSLLGIEGLFPPQREALERGVERGRSLLVAAPTGAGKSLVAMIAAVNALPGGDGQAFYLVPLKSIAQEKFRDFRVLERLGLRVRVSVGDYTGGPPDADLVIATYEKMDSMLRNDRGLAERVRLLVIDEVHVAGDPKRGPVLEAVVARLLSRGEPQVLGLSATVPNVDEIARWLGAEPLVSKWRPVPLREAVFKDYRLYFEDGAVREVARVHGYPDLDLALEAAARGGQTLVFSQSRRRAMSLARRAARRARLPFNRSVAREAAARVEEASGAPRSLREELAGLLRRGVAYHHAGLTSELRGIVEDAFREGGVAVLYSTPTLAAGVNLPARLVVVDEYYRFEGGVREPIRVAEYKQLAGRAGRPGYDEEGLAVIVAEAGDEPEELLDWYVRSKPERVESRLYGVQRLRHLALGLIASGEAASRGDVERILSRTLYAVQGGNLREYLARALRDLWEWGLLEGDLRGRLHATPLGYTVSKLYLDPETVVVTRDLLERAGGLDEDTALLLVAMSPDMVRLPVPRREEDRVMEALLDEAPGVLRLLDWLGPEEMSAAKTMLVLKAWVNEESEDAIYERWGVAPGDLAAMAETGEWVASALSQLIPLLGAGEGDSRLLRSLAKRIRYGVKQELLPLVSLPGVGRVRARRLYDAGYRTLHDLAMARPEDLLRIQGIGVATVRSILEAVGRREEAEAYRLRERIARRGLLAFIDDEGEAVEEAGP